MRPFITVRSIGAVQSVCEQNEIDFTLSSWQGEDNEGNIARYSVPERTFFEEMAPSHRKKGNELVFMDCRYEVMLDDPVTRVEMADVLTLTGRIRNDSQTSWEVGTGTGRWRVACYLTRIGRRKPWLRSFAPTAGLSRAAQRRAGVRAAVAPAACRPASRGWLDMIRRLELRRIAPKAHTLADAAPLQFEVVEPQQYPRAGKGRVSS